MLDTVLEIMKSRQLSYPEIEFLKWLIERDYVETGPIECVITIDPAEIERVAKQRAAVKSGVLDALRSTANGDPLPPEVQEWKDARLAKQAQQDTQ